ncbi:MAG: hypothetical protein CEE38_15480 [Planctomycetes bacterium B3_Pla]|nr:MAG: hypothetical protein CEE38_15480 [Planctomycetes bacterium B3_Pla]
MKQLMSSIVISIMAVFLVGCAKPCFYQAGKSIEQCEHDLLECSGSPRLTRFCMQARGYRYLDANELPRDRKRTKVVVPFGEYWIVDGLDIATEDRELAAEQEPQKSNPDSPVNRRIRYRVKRDSSGKRMTDAYGNFVLVPVQEDERRIAHSGRLGDK